MLQGVSLVNARALEQRTLRRWTKQFNGKKLRSLVARRETKGTPQDFYFRSKRQLLCHLSPTDGDSALNCRALSATLHEVQKLLSRALWK